MIVITGKNNNFGTIMIKFELVKNHEWDTKSGKLGSFNENGVFSCI